MGDFPTVTCAGVITVDVIAITDAFPPQEGRIEAEDVMITGGGPASNAAVVLARQGISVAVVGRVGDDQAGRQAVSMLAAEGVDTSGIYVDPTISTQTSCIIVDRPAGTRSIVTSKVNPLPHLSERGLELIANSKWLHVDHLGYRAGVEACSKLNTRPLVSLDSGNAPIADLDLSLIDLYVPTTEALTKVAGVDNIDQAAALALEGGCGAVVATEGSNGSRAWWDATAAQWGQEEGAGNASAPAFTKFQMTSTLGAGDVFHGALLSTLIQGYTWTVALERANAIAALSCEGRDGREKVPTRERLDVALEIS